jgi:hypothetical protein
MNAKRKDIITGPQHVETAIEEAMMNGISEYLFEKKNTLSKVIKNNKILNAVKTMSNRSYWTKVNTVEAWGFATKIAIIFPGLLLDKQWWWLYIFAIISSVSLIWTSTRKTLPTIILFNVAWVTLASLSILKHFWWF